MHLLTCINKSFSIKELRRQLGHKRYQPIWEMINKLGDVMGKRDNEYQLSGQMEPEESFFTTEIPLEQKNEPLKRGRGSQCKSKVLVKTESAFLENPKEKRYPKRVSHIKMIVINGLKSNTITGIVKEQFDKSAELITDDSTLYSNLKKNVKSHKAAEIKSDLIPTLFLCVHIAISNAKRLSLCMHHKLKNEYLHYYLNVYCYKFNKRCFRDKILDILLNTAVSYTHDFNSKIYKRTLFGLS